MALYSHYHTHIHTHTHTHTYIHTYTHTYTQSSASARVVNQLLTEMDGLEARKQVFIMAATNRPGKTSLDAKLPGSKLLFINKQQVYYRSCLSKEGFPIAAPRLHRGVCYESLNFPQYFEVCLQNNSKASFIS